MEHISTALEADRDLIRALEKRSQAVSCAEDCVLFSQGDAPRGGVHPANWRGYTDDEIGCGRCGDVSACRIRFTAWSARRYWKSTLLIDGDGA